MKLAISVALSHHPQLLILDEATSGLDPIMRDEILDVFLEFVQEEDHSILLSSHITSDLEKIADYIMEASNPVPTPLLGHRCRSSQEITGSPTPFSTSNHYLWICASASFSLSNPNIAA